MVDLFTYGTLMSPEVMHALTGREFPRGRGVANGYARCALQHRIYPGMAPQRDAETRGLVYRSLDQETLRMLDWFEDDFYSRASISVSILEGAAITAEAYLVLPPHDRLLTEEPWEWEAFVRQHLPSYLAKCRFLRREFLRTHGLAGDSQP